MDLWLGAYASPTRPGEQDPLTLTISREPAPNANERRYVWTQTHPGDDRSKRRFLIRVSEQNGQLVSSFSPMGRPASASPSCPLRWQLARSDRGTGRQPVLLGRTDVTTCQFGSAEAPMALLKEIAFDGERLRVADRVMGPNPSQDAPAPQVTEFFTRARFRGTIGIEEGELTRASPPVELATDGQPHSAADAAGMPLGVVVAIDRVYIGQTVKLRLMVSEAGSNRVLGQALSDPNSDTLGWANQTVQAVFRRIRSD